MLLLKRLAETAAEGDRVLAVLRAAATNQDGRMINIATQSRLVQLAMYRDASAVYLELKAQQDNYFQDVVESTSRWPFVNSTP